MSDISAFLRPRQRKADREAALARLRQQVKAGTLEIHWMSEEEKAAYRLREPLETPATMAAAGEADRCEPSNAPAHAHAREGIGGLPGQREDPVEGSIRLPWLAPIVQRYRAGYNALAGATFQIVRRATPTRAADPSESTGAAPAPVEPEQAEQPPNGVNTEV